MVRHLVTLASIELALIALCFGMPSAQADPGQDCCFVPKHDQCSGCLDGYNWGAGELWGCDQAPPYPGCYPETKECARLTATDGNPITIYTDNCTVPVGQNFGLAIKFMQGCSQQQCD